MPAPPAVRPKKNYPVLPVAPSPVPLVDCLQVPTISTFTSKEWVLPPRPKPGRKPATDVPPTKRKAQNRAAQRAFRERRAQRVGELEERIKEIETERDQIEDGLRQQIETLEAQLEQWRAKYHIEAKKNGTFIAEPQLPLSPNTTSPGVIESPRDPATPALGCDKCTVSHCQCLSEILSFQPYPDSQKRPFSPPASLSPASSTQRSTKRRCPDPSELETDFTLFFSNGPPTTNADKGLAFTHGCGLCDGGSPCLCKSIEDESRAQHTTPLRSPPIPAPKKSGPGSCAKCQTDPQARLFCTSLASLRTPTTSCSRPEGCCGGGCRDGPQRDNKSGVLSCAETYNRLSEHPSFAEAMKSAKERETWLPRLAKKNKQDEKESPGPLEIEAASVMGVLKLFERRFQPE